MEQTSTTCSVSVTSATAHPGTHGRCGVLEHTRLCLVNQDLNQTEPCRTAELCLLWLNLWLVGSCLRSGMQCEWASEGNHLRTESLPRAACIMMQQTQSHDPVNPVLVLPADQAARCLESRSRSVTAGSEATRLHQDRWPSKS